MNIPYLANGNWEANLAALWQGQQLTERSVKADEALQSSSSSTYAGWSFMAGVGLTLSAGVAGYLRGRVWALGFGLSALGAFLVAWHQERAYKALEREREGAYAERDALFEEIVTEVDKITSVWVTDCSTLIGELPRKQSNNFVVQQEPQFDDFISVGFYEGPPVQWESENDSKVNSMWSRKQNEWFNAHWQSPLASLRNQPSRVARQDISQVRIMAVVWPSSRAELAGSRLLADPKTLHLGEKGIEFQWNEEKSTYKIVPGKPNRKW